MYISESNLRAISNGEDPNLRKEYFTDSINRHKNGNLFFGEKGNKAPASSSK
jgi:hypothetical protein